MKTIILIVIVAAIVLIGIKSLYKMFKGQGSCGCCSSKDGKGSCIHKDNCKH